MVASTVDPGGGSSSPSSPACTSVIPSVAVNGFEMEAIRKTVSGDTASPPSREPTPSATATASPARRTPTAIPGTFQRCRASATHCSSCCAETRSIRRLLPYCETAAPAVRVPWRAVRRPRRRISRRKINASYQGSKTGDHRPAWSQRGGHRLAAGSDRALDTACQRDHRALARAPEGTLLATRPAEAGRPPAAAPAVPAKARPRGVSRADPGARPEEVMGEIRCQASAWFRRELHATEGGSLSQRAADALTQTSTFKKEVEDR